MTIFEAAWRCYVKAYIAAWALYIQLRSVTEEFQ